MTDRSPYRTPVQPVVPEDWHDQALCAEVDTEIFFPEKGQLTHAALNICRACPVTNECLQYALDRHEPYGIYGGLTGIERRRLRRVA